jgi:hypothetical protein
LLFFEVIVPDLFMQHELPAFIEQEPPLVISALELFDAQELPVIVAFEVFDAQQDPLADAFLPEHELLVITAFEFFDAQQELPLVMTALEFFDSQELPVIVAFEVFDAQQDPLADAFLPEQELLVITALEFFDSQPLIEAFLPSQETVVNVVRSRMIRWLCLRRNRCSPSPWNRNSSTRRMMLRSCWHRLRRQQEQFPS